MSCDADDQLNGQMSLLDIGAEVPETDCGYTFKRYIGQQVIVTCPANSNYGTVGKIIYIEPYYTRIRTENGKIISVAPYDISSL